MSATIAAAAIGALVALSASSRRSLAVKQKPPTPMPPAIRPPGTPIVSGPAPGPGPQKPPPAIFRQDALPQKFFVGDTVRVNGGIGRVSAVRQDGVTWSYQVTMHGISAWFSEDSLTLLVEGSGLPAEMSSSLPI